MLRPSATFAFVLAELLFTASAGCSASMPPREVSPAGGFGGRKGPQVGHGTVDVENVCLPAVAVLTSLHYSDGLRNAPCSGVLVAPDVVLTAAHCVCAPRAPTPEDMRLLETLVEPLSDAGTARPRALDEMTFTEIYDASSSCSTLSLVTTVVYGKPGEKQFYDPKEYLGRVVVHRELQYLQGTKNGEWWVFRNHADLAAIHLDRPVPFPPIGLPSSEVKVGDALVMAGYGPTELGGRKDAGPRRSGDNVATELVKFGNGNTLIATADQPSPDGGVPAHTRKGDSGGPLIRKSDPNVLVGICTMGEKLEDGGEISYFTSAFENVGWILERIEQGPPADAGVLDARDSAGR